MADYEDLKRLAEAAYEAAPFPDMKKLGAAHRKFYAKAGPQVVLALIAENEELKQHNEFLAGAPERFSASLRAVAEALGLGIGRNVHTDCVPAIAKLKAENEALKASLDSPDELTAEPAGNYDALRLQFFALRTLANMKCRMAEHWQKQCGKETRETLLANAANVNAERDTNALLTDALEAAEAERDQLKAENERLRQNAKLDAADLAWSESDSREQSAEIGQLKAELERVRADAERLDWLLHNISGRALRAVGVILSGDRELDRAAVDAAMGKGGEA